MPESCEYCGAAPGDRHGPLCESILDEVLERYRADQGETNPVPEPGNLAIGDGAVAYEPLEISIRTPTLQGRGMMTEVEFEIIKNVIGRMSWMRL